VWRHRAVCEHALAEILSQVLAPPATAAGPAHLEVISGADGGPFPLDGPEMVAGRGAPADIILPSVTISRRHCRFIRESTGWVVEDLQSANGIKVNDRAGQRFSLSGGDRIEIGAMMVRFVEGSAAGPPAPLAPGVCPKCGHQNSPHFKFCLGCGDALP